MLFFGGAEGVGVYLSLFFLMYSILRIPERIEGRTKMQEERRTYVRHCTSLLGEGCFLLSFIYWFLGVKYLFWRANFVYYLVQSLA